VTLYKKGFYEVRAAYSLSRAFFCSVPDDSVYMFMVVDMSSWPISPLTVAGLSLRIAKSDGNTWRISWNLITGKSAAV
jgi:hypothetical protein